MVSKSSSLIFSLFVLGAANLQFQCNKKFGCTETVYSFEIGIRAYPAKDSISVGDTIWLEVNEPTTLIDSHSGTMVDYSDAANLGSAIGFQAYSLATGQFTDNAAQRFNFLIIQGTETANTNSQLYHEYRFAQPNNRYLFKLGVIPKERGVYRLGFSNAANVYRKHDKCTKASFTLNFKDTEQHFYLFPGGAGTPAGGGAYYFKVN